MENMETGSKGEFIGNKTSNGRNNQSFAGNRKMKEVWEHRKE
jgi:hypothetical protein